jgi:hypothetical protein
MLIALTELVVRIAGIRHYQLDFPANSHPPEPLVQTFLDICDKEGVLAVHCRAGLGYTSAYVSIRQHASACVSMRQLYVSIRQHTSAYVSIRQHTSAYYDRIVRGERCACPLSRGPRVYYICVRMLLNMCPHATIYVPACYYI